MNHFLLFLVPVVLHGQGVQLSDLIQHMRQHHRTGDQASVGRLVHLILEEVAKPHPAPISALAWNQVGIYYATRGNFAAAEHAYRRGIRLVDSREPNAELPTLLINLAEAFLQRGTRPGEADALALRALRLTAEVYGPNSPELTQYLYILGACRQQLGKYRDAERYFGEALNLVGNNLEGRILRGIILGNISVLSALARDWSTARNRSLEALELLRESLGPSHPDLIRPTLNVARLSQHLGLSDQASAYIETARLITEATLGWDHPVMAEVLETSAINLRKQRRVAQARELRQRARRIRELQPGDPRMSTVHVSDLLRR